MNNNGAPKVLKAPAKSAPKPVPKKKVEEKVTFSERTQGIKDFFNSIVNEMKKVTWPDRQALTAYTAVVLFAVAFICLLIYVFDSGIGFVLQKLFEWVGKPI